MSDTEGILTAIACSTTLLIAIAWYGVRLILEYLFTIKDQVIDIRSQLRRIEDDQAARAVGEFYRRTKG